MPLIKDCMLWELALRRAAIKAEELDHARAIQDELAGAGIQRPLSSILTERKIASRELVASLSDEIAKSWIRCKRCSKQSALSLVEVSGNLECKYCQTKIEYTYERISESDFTTSPKTEVKGMAGKESHDPPALHPPRQQQGKESVGSREATALRGAPEGAPQKTAQTPPVRTERPFEDLAAEDLAATRDVTKFRPRELLGVSSFGRLYLVQEGTRASAIKIFDRSLSQDRARIKKWSDYMQRVQDLPSTVTQKPVQLFREGAATYALRPFLGKKGASFKSFLLEREASDATPASVRLQLGALLRSLSEFHEAQLAHGNLKPENILLLDDGICLSDPGFQLLLDSLPPEERISRLLDASRYVAPELLQGSPPTPMSDLFAVGRVLEDLIPASRHSEKADTASWHPLRELAQRLTQVDPASRPESAAEALRLLESLKLDSSSRDSRTRMALKSAAKRVKANLSSAWIGHAALAFVMCTLLVKGWTWYREKARFTNPTRSDAIASQYVSQEIEALSKWSAGSGNTKAAIEKRWQDLETLLRTTPFEARVKQARTSALAQLPASQDSSASLANRIRTLAEKQNWIKAVEELVRAGDVLSPSEEINALRTRVLEGLLRDEGMVLIPGEPGATGPEGESSPAPRAFLVDVKPACRDTGAAVSSSSSGMATFTAVTGVDFGEAHMLAVAQGKRLPTSEEWDRMSRLTAAKSGGWVAPYTERIIFLSGLFEWVDDASEDELAKQGFGILKGGGRKGIPPTHALRRKKTVGYADVGVRFVKDI